MKLFTKKKVLALVSTIVLFFNAQSQIVGGREPGEIAPTEVKPSDLVGDQFSNSVNLFNGSYGGSYSLGSVSTPLGLSFNLTMNYSSSKSAGGTEAISRGIPYGDGWNLNIPTVSVKTKAYKTYMDVQTAGIAPTANDHHNQNALNFDSYEGDLFVYAIDVNIPGVTSFRAIYKYENENGLSVFMPEEFENYAKVVKSGDYWEVHLEDGTIYFFNKVVRSFRASSNNNAVYDYTTGGLVGASNNVKATDQIMPKEEYLSWYCTRIRNRNAPGEGIAFYYEEFGEFNYFKEFNNQNGIDAHFNTTSVYGGSLGLGKYKDFTVFKDLLLTQVVGLTQIGDYDKIELEYKTQKRGYYMLNHYMNADVTRVDSLYNKKTVYNTEDVGIRFRSWKQYHHAALDILNPTAPATPANNLYSDIGKTNPYRKHNGVEFKYNRSTVSPTNSNNTLAFNHSYLESTRLGSTPAEAELIIPGETYEVKTKISGGGFGNYDINIVTGKYAASFETGNDVDPAEYDQAIGYSQNNVKPAIETIFSTFGSAMKWNLRGNNSSSITTSNYFTMPDLPSEYQGYFLQVGPANSDHLFNMSEYAVKNSNNNQPSAYNAYNRSAYHNQYVDDQDVNQYFSPIPRNFGIGMPWYMMSDIVKNLGSGVASEGSTDYDFWFQRTAGNNSYEQHTNEPTLAGSSVLSDVEIIRYSKNPYMLTSVKTYKAAGRTPVYEVGTKKDYELVKSIKLTYEMLKHHPIDDKVYQDGDLLLENTAREIYSYALTAIENVPTDPTQENAGFDASNTVDSYFEYTLHGPMNYDDETTLTSRFYLLTGLTNALGKETVLNYHTVEDSSLISKIYLMSGSEKIAYLQDPNKNIKRRKEALQVTPVVRSVSVKNGDNSFTTVKYAYSWDKIAHQKLGSQALNLFHFDINGSQKANTGFYETKVYQPKVNDKRNYTKYTHFTSEPIVNFTVPYEYMNEFLGGKVAKLEQFNDDDALVKESTFTYRTIHAYENGFERINDDNGGWKFDYMDYFMNDPNNHNTNVTNFKNYFTTNGVSFSPVDLHYHKAFFPEEVSSYSTFIFLRKQSDKVYDDAICSANQGGSVNANPTLANNRGGYINTASTTNDQTLITLIDEAEEYFAIEDDLIEDSPLSDVVLETLLSKADFQNQTNFTNLLNAQPALSDSIMELMFTDPILRHNNVFDDFIVGYQDTLTEFILGKIADNMNYVAESSYESNLIKSSPLSDVVLDKVVSEALVSQSLVENVLLQQPTLSTQIRLDVVSRGLASGLTIERVEIILTAHTPYPTDSVLQHLIVSFTEAAPEEVMSVLTQAPTPHTIAIENEVQLYSEDFGLDAMNAFTNFQNGGASSNPESGNGSNTNDLFIETITEFEYYTAFYDGTTDSEGYKDIMGLQQLSSFKLKYEPSWQLYSTTISSPQYEGAYSKKKQYYYYDLRNRYDRFANLYNANAPVTVDMNYTSNGDNINPVHYFSNIQVNHPEPDGLRNAVKYDIRNTSFQEATESKNGLSSEPTEINTYYEYHSRWGEHDNFVTTVYEDMSDSSYYPNGCPTNYATTCGNPVRIPNIQVQQNKQTLEYSFPTIGGNVDIYMTKSNGREYFFYVDASISCVFSPETLLVLPYGSSTNSNPEMMPIEWEFPDAIRLSSVNIQVDDEATKAYANIHGSTDFRSMYGNQKILSFKDVGNVIDDPIDPMVSITYDDTYYQPVYPFNTLDKTKILKRTALFYPEVIEDEKGLRTRFNYDELTHIRLNDVICNYNSPELVDYGNANKPNSMEVYYDGINTMTTSFEYYPDLSTHKIINPHGLEIEYRYDASGRVKEELQNNQLINKYDYHYWDKDETKTFTERAADNYKESIHFPNKGNDEAVILRQFIDPLGREYQTISGELANGLGSKTVTTAEYSGKTVFDNLNRPLSRQKAFGFTDMTAFDLLPKVESNDLTKYPNVSATMLYEEGWTGRVLETASYGETLGTDHTVENAYHLMNVNCIVSELGLSTTEVNLLLPQGLNFPYVFSRSQLTDQDGKSSYTYTNALGQQIASRQEVTTGESAITLQAYNNLGAVELVINPEKQESKYYYNKAGWLYKKETVDGGVTKYMYNKSGQVVLEQDEKAAAGRFNSETNQVEPFITVHKYDRMGRLVSSGDAFISGLISINNVVTENSSYSPLAYENLEIGAPNAITQANPYFKYEFGSNSTYSWLAKAIVTVEDYSTNTLQYIASHALMFTAIDKVTKRIENHYDNSTGMVLDNLLAPTFSTLRLNNYKSGKLAYSLKYKDGVMEPLNGNNDVIAITYFNYNRRGSVVALLKQFNPNGITTTAHGLISAQFYDEFTRDGIAQNHMVDIHADGKIDFQNYKFIDKRGRIKELFANITDEKQTGNKIATYLYDNVHGKLSEKHLMYTRAGTSYSTEDVIYNYDLKERLTGINSDWMDYNLYYDANQASYSNGHTPSGDQSYNGNINGLKVKYKFAKIGGAPMIDVFDHETVYNYTYDGLNRLTAADAAVGDFVDGNALGSASYNHGDVSFTFDKVGNITELNRTIDGTNGKQHWLYNYSLGNNKLTSVSGQAGTVNRSYTYDVAGNLKSDNSRGITLVEYEKNNLATRMQKSLNGISYEVDYQYDANGSRIFKQYKQLSGAAISGVEAAEYYLQGAGGETVGILDLTTTNWLWYVHGTDRVATLSPKDAEQPTSYLNGFVNSGSLTIDGVSLNELRQALSNYMQLQNPGAEDLLVMTSFNEEEEEVESLITETAYQQMMQSFPEGEEPPNTEVLISFTSPQEIIVVKNNAGIAYTTSLEEIYYAAGQGNTLPDNSGYWPSKIIDNNGEIIIIPQDDPQPPAYTPGKLSYYTYDHLGNTRVVHSASWNASLNNGTGGMQPELSGLYDYFPYGKILREYSVVNGGERYLSTGHERDHESISEISSGTGLDNRGLRLYDSDIARFIGVDPFASQRNWLNPYNYVQNNPIMRIDPTGGLDGWVEDADGNITWDEHVYCQEDLNDRGRSDETFIAEEFTGLDDNTGVLIRYNEDGSKTEIPQWGSSEVDITYTRDSHERALYAGRELGIYKNQVSFINTSVDLSGEVFEQSGDAVTWVGIVTMQPELIALGGALSGVGTGIKSIGDMRDGNYDKAMGRAVSYVINKGIGRGIGKASNNALDESILSGTQELVNEAFK